jgi:hypothetical protein
MLWFAFAVLLITSCKKNNGTITPQLSASPSEIVLPASGGTTDLTINGNANWTYSNGALWLQLSKTSGNSGNSTIQLSATSNETGATRSITLSVDAANGRQEEFQFRNHLRYIRLTIYRPRHQIQSQ